MAFFSFLCLFSSKAIAQSWHAGIGAGAARLAVVDKEFSSLVFDGIGAGGSVVVGYHGELLLQEFNASYIYGLLSNKQSKADELSQSVMEFTYTALLNLTRDDARVHWRAGGRLGFLNNQRNFDKLVNKQDASDRLFSLSAVVDLAIPLGSSDSWLLNNRIQLPVANFFSQSVEAVRGDWQFGGPVGDATYIANALSLQHELNKQHRLSLGYQWNYYQLKKQLQVNRATHQITITYYYKW